MFTFISVYNTVLPIASLIITKCWLVSVAHDGNEHESGLSLSISTAYTMPMQFHFRDRTSLLAKTLWPDGSDKSSQRSRC